tara:strand:- start:4662 stop:4787 length:126 start_codon:yes stop_codon:yes gene_type:complete
MKVKEIIEVLKEVRDQPITPITKQKVEYMLDDLMLYSNIVI